jgi:excisionase family DNA binding protein
MRGIVGGYRGACAPHNAATPRAEPLQSRAAGAAWAQTVDKCLVITDPQHRLRLSTSEAAVHLGVSISTVRRWSDVGCLPGYRTPGGQRRFSLEQIERFVASLEQRNGSAREI